MHVAAVRVGGHFHGHFGLQMQINQVVFALPRHQAAPVNGVGELDAVHQRFRAPVFGQDFAVVDELAGQQGAIHLDGIEGIHNVGGIERDLALFVAVRQHLAHFAQSLARRHRGQMILLHALRNFVFRLQTLQRQPESVQAHQQRFLFVYFHQDTRQDFAAFI